MNVDGCLPLDSNNPGMIEMLVYICVECNRLNIYKASPQGEINFPSSNDLRRWGL